MNQEQFRAAVFSDIEAWHAANFSGNALVSENGPVPDEDEISSPWIDLSIRWYNGEGLTIGEVVKGRYTGAVAMAIYSRSGSGTAQAARIADSAAQHLSRRRFGSSVLKFPTPYTPTDLRGWYKTGLMFPFVLDV